jgi:ribosome-binding protein aMBF1 (putative translation factor)
MAGFAAAHGLARLTFTQRTIEAALPSQNQRLWRNNVLQNHVQTIGRMIVASRKQVGLTQRQLAQKVAIPRKSIGRWERGRAIPNRAQWGKLAATLPVLREQGAIAATLPVGIVAVEREGSAARVTVFDVTTTRPTAS